MPGASPRAARHPCGRRTSIGGCHVTPRGAGPGRGEPWARRSGLVGARHRLAGRRADRLAGSGRILAACSSDGMRRSATIRDAKWRSEGRQQAAAPYLTIRPSTGLLGRSEAIAVGGLRGRQTASGLYWNRRAPMRCATGDPRTMPLAAAARSLEAQNVDLIYSWSTSVSLAVVRATKKVPIVFYAGTDPVAVGLVGNSASLAGESPECWVDHGPHGEAPRDPARYDPELPAGRDLLRPPESGRAEGREARREAARQLKMELVEHRAARSRSCGRAFERAPAREADAYFHVSDSMMTSQTR